jgi:hypothetical protein
MAGIGELRVLIVPTVGVFTVPQSVESTPGGTDCLVVVAGVSVGCSVAPGVEPAIAEPWWSGRWGDIRALLRPSTSGVSSGLLAEYDSAAEYVIVGIALLELQLNAWSLCNVVESCGRGML